MKTLNLSLSKGLLKYAVLLLFAFSSLNGMSQKFMLQGWWWEYPQTYGIVRFGENYLNWLPDFKEAGFDYIWLPPLSRAAGGISSMGYDVKDYYDIGNRFTGGSTHFGNNTDVTNLTKAMHQIGIQPIADMVYNQRSGGLFSSIQYIPSSATAFENESKSTGLTI